MKHPMSAPQSVKNKLSAKESAQLKKMVPNNSVDRVALNRNASINVEWLRKMRQQIQIVASEQVEYRGSGIFASPPHILKEGKLINPFTSTEPIHPPVPNDWLIKYRLEYWKPDLLDMDVKGDGFTILENYRTNTDPIDPNIHALPHVKLRLKKTICEPFGVTFTGTPDGGRTFMVNIRNDLLQTTYFLKRGEFIRIKDSLYALKGYQRKLIFRASGLEVDVSELTLKHSMEQIVLKMDEEINFPTCYAVFQYHEKEIKVKKAATFLLPHREDDPYRLIDITESQAIVEHLNGGERYIISMRSRKSVGGAQNQEWFQMSSKNNDQGEADSQ